MAQSAVDVDLLDRAGAQLAVHGPRATITLDRPDQLNAQTPVTWQALREIGENLDPELRIVVVRGEGRAFSGGLDRRLLGGEQVGAGAGLASLARQPAERADAEIGRHQRGFSWLREPDRVTVAAVQG